MTIETTVGIDVTGKPINLAQLQTELVAAGVTVTGLGTAGPGAEGQSQSVWLFTYDAQGQAIDFPSDQQATVTQVVGAHIGMRDKTSAEYAAEFQDPNTTAVRRQEIRDIQNGLLPAEQVPM